MNTDIVIVGAGPAGIFTAIEMIRRGSKKHITIVEKGQPIEKRRCPKTVTKQCVNCRPYCHITTGFSGAGAFSDGKLSLSHEVGGDFPTLIGEQNAQDLIDYTDGIYLEFGADSHVEGIGNTEEVREIRRRAIQAGLKLVDCPIRHLGTEKAQTLYLALENYLRDNDVELLFGWECEELLMDGETCLGVSLRKGDQTQEIRAGHGLRLLRKIDHSGAAGVELLQSRSIPLCCQIGNFNTDLGRVFDGSIEGVKRHHVLTADDDCLVTGAQRHGIDLAAEGCRFRSESHNL